MTTQRSAASTAIAGRGPRGRSAPEWITFVASLVILCAVVVVLVVLAFRTDEPAAPAAARPGAARMTDGHFFVPVDIVNHGDEGAAEIQVSAELVIAGETVSAEQTIDFLGGGEVQQLTFVFADDPAQGELNIVVTGYAAP